MPLLGYDPRTWEPLAARLMLAWLEDDPELVAFYREQVRRESDCTDEYFGLADCAAHIFASGYRDPANRERARKHLTEFLIMVTESV